LRSAWGLLFSNEQREERTMMLIDMTHDLTPLLFGFNAAMIVSALAIVGGVVSSWFASLRIERPRLVVHRPALAR